MTTQQPMISYHLTVLHPETLTALVLSDLTFYDWSEVEERINQDKARYYDRSGLPIEYTAYDGQVEVNGSFGAAS